MKVAIIGSRGYPDPDCVRAYVRALPADSVVVSGGARGVDRIAVDEAKRCGLETEVYPALWELEGRSAGFRRNRRLVAAADRVVAFWDGESRGTRHAIDVATVLKKPLVVIRVDGELKTSP